MDNIEQAMRELAAADCHCASCARTGLKCSVRDELQRLPVSKGGLNECKTRGGYLPSDDPLAVSELYYRYRGLPERTVAKRENRYDAYRLAVTLFVVVDRTLKPNGETNLLTFAELLDYDPEELRADVDALKQIAEDAL